MAKAFPEEIEEEAAPREKERIGVTGGIAVTGLGALASAAYGPEAALAALGRDSAGGGAVFVAIFVFVVASLLLVGFSYWQAIAAFPDGGGSYTVARENLGENAGLFTASALCVDYVLNVAVGIAAGVGAVVSAAPVLSKFTLPACLGILALLTLVNLRGIRAAGWFVCGPAYLFVGCLAIMVGLGIYESRIATEPTAKTHAAQIPFWLTLQAAAAGLTSLTGVEAMSNAVPIFRRPRKHGARATQFLTVYLLAGLLLGISLLVAEFHISALPQGAAGYKTVISQLMEEVAGRGWFYYVAMTAVLAALALSANSSFADFPHVCSTLASDKCLPPCFANEDGKSIFWLGILALAAAAGILLVVFGGNVQRLIPVFAISAFMAYTMSQLGMAVYWKRSRGRRHRIWMALNLIGATITATALLVFVVFTFAGSAWIAVVAIPAIVGMFKFFQRRLAR
jgi:amino acid transporter